jgi:hypothetical protein
MQEASYSKKEDDIAVSSVDKPKTVEEGYDTDSVRIRPNMLANTLVDTFWSSWEGN